MALGCLFIFSVFVWGFFVVSLFLLILIKFFFEVNFHHYVVNLYLFVAALYHFEVNLCLLVFKLCLCGFWGISCVFVGRSHCFTDFHFPVDFLFCFDHLVSRCGQFTLYISFCSSLASLCNCFISLCSDFSVSYSCGQNFVSSWA